ncbi:MAG: L-ascorbate metabolism protein UlaG (beta-lactamase superfamily) [Candidatus Paceibacteria bacterium]|jgi:L-ascorbate metabolism protein UlaG (beta-lactamase superfamily)
MSYTSRTMVISYHGGQCFKLSFGSTTIAFNPISKKSKLEQVKFGVDVAFVTMWHPDFNGVEQVAHGSKQPFVVDGPGEYEVGQVTARGFGVKTIYDKVEHFNTIYQVHLEDMNIIFMGSLSDPDIDPKILTEFGDIDILFLPVGGGDVLEVPQAAKLAVKLEAKLIIPMHYDAVSLKTFLKEESNENQKPIDKLTIKRKDIQTMSGEVVVLKS